MSTQWLTVPQEQRLDVLGDLNSETQNVWIGLHGYGQLVHYFQRHFRGAVVKGRAFVFPQGTHKFYLNGVEGRVGASWMTKDNREVDIENQRMYLNAVLTWVRNRAQGARIHVVGFSQGVATGMRFLGHSVEPVEGFLAWAGSWPPDLDERSLAGLRGTHFKGWFGTDDAFIGLEKQERILAHYRENYGLELPVERYEGGHKFDLAILEREIGAIEVESVTQKKQ